jgi:cation-transporting P-type ATPase I
MPAVSRRCRRLAGRELRQPLEWSRQGATVLAIERGGRLVGLIRVVREMDPLAEAVVARARAAGSVRLAGKGSHLEQRLHVDGVVPGGSRLLSSIRELQQAGRWSLSCPLARGTRWRRRTSASG